MTSYQNLEKLNGQLTGGRAPIFAPKDANDTEGAAAYRAAIGVPKDVTGYKVPEALAKDPLTATILEASLKHGVPAASLNSALADIATARQTIEQQQQQQFQQQNTAAIAELRGQMGAEFDANLEHAKRAARMGSLQGKLSEEDSALFLKAASEDPRFIKFLSGLGRAMGEHSFAGADRGGSTSNANAAIDKQISDLRQQRVENKIDQKTYLSEMDRLQNIRSAA